MNRLFKNKWRLATVICAVSMLAVLMCPVGVHIEPPLSSSTIELGQHQVTFTLGTEAYAAGVADYTCDGTDDNVQFQQALDALPALGGKLVILVGDYSFSDAVSRAIDDVTIQGVGKASYIARDGVNPVFSAGSQSNWVFRDFSTDAGGITVSSATAYTLQNVTIGTDYIAYDTDSDITGADWLIPTGRAATFVVAASDSKAVSKAQADYVCDGTNDQVEIQAAIDALPAGGGKVVLMEGEYLLSLNVVVNKANVSIEGQGDSTVLKIADATSSALTIDAAVDQKDVTVASATGFQVGQQVTIYDDRRQTGAPDQAEYNEIASINGNTLTMVDSLSYTYQVANLAEVWSDIHAIYATADSVHLKTFKVDGNKANQFEHVDWVTPTTLDDVTDKEACIHIGIYYGAVIYDAIVEHVHIDGANKQGIGFYSVERLTLIGGLSENNDGNGISVDCFSADFRIVGTWSVSNFDEGFEVEPGADRGVLLSCHVENTRAGSGLAYSISGNQVNCIGCTVKDQTPYPFGYFGFCILGSNCSLIGCQAYNCHTPYRVVASGNNFIISGCHAVDTEDYGIRIEANVENGLITDCIIDGDDGVTAILILANVTYIAIKDIKITGTWTNGIALTTALAPGTDYIDIAGIDMRLATIVNKWQVEENQHGIMYRQYTDLFMDVLAVNATGVRSNEDLSEGIPNTFTLDAQPDVPRTLSGHFDSHAQITAYTIVITGTDAKGNTVTETFTEAVSPWDFETSNAFATVTSIIMTARTGTGAGDTMDIGVTDVLGLSNVIYATGDVFKIKKNNANAVVAGAQVDTDYDTYDMAVIGLAGDDDFTIWYRSNLNIIS